MKIQRGIFQEDVLSLLLLMISNNFTQLHTLKGALRTTNSQNQKKKINHFIYMDDIEFFAKIEKEFETDRNNNIYS